MIKIAKALITSTICTLMLASCSTNSLTVEGIDSSVSKISSFSDVKDSENLAAINNAIDFATSTKNTDNNFNVKFYMDGKNAFPAIENMLLNAKESIHIELFQYHNDYTGRKFADALIQKVKEGVEVKLLYDFFGNVDISLMNHMAKNGVHVDAYNKGVVTSKGFNITHRKVYIVDGVRAMTGGMNMGQKYAMEWHDTMMGFEGEAVKETMKEFIYDWEKAGNKKTRFMTECLTKEVKAPENQETYPLRVVVTSPSEPAKKEGIKRMMIAAIDSAKDNVKVAMPYFSDDEFIEHLIFAAKRGVKVQAYMPKKNNQKLFDTVSAITSNQLVQGNVEVYRTGAKDNAFSHSKVLTVDSIWSTIGSCNADHRAFHVNQELNVGISSPSFAKEVNSVFFDFHLGNSEKWEYKKVPWYKKPLYSFIEGMDDLI